MSANSLLAIFVVCLILDHGSLTVNGQSDMIKVDITCDNELWFYADGHVIVNASTPGNADWETTKHVMIPADTRIYGIKCLDYHVVAGIIASFGDGTTTDNSWRCTNKKPKDGWLSAGYDDSDWQSAYVIHQNSAPSTYWGIRNDISRQASWIWTKGWQGQDKTVYCRKVKSVQSEWGSWSAWTVCQGDCHSAVQTRTRRCSGHSCPGSDLETKKCVLAVQEQDCARCTLNAANIGYLPNCDDPSKYYQCQKRADGSYQLTLMSCPRCTIWHEAELTCVHDTSLEDCDSESEEQHEVIITHGSTCTSGDLNFGVVPGDSTKYVMYNFGVEVQMSCPESTEFNLTTCGCVNAASTNPTEEEDLLPELCLDFEKMDKGSEWGFSEGRYWIGNHGKYWNSKHVQVSTDRCIEGTKCASFAGQCYLSIDSLANAFHTWPTFSISFWYWPDHLGTMGLFTNGLTNGCSGLPTVAMTTTNGRLNGRVAFKDRVAVVKGQVIRKSWNHVVLVKDDDVVKLYVNGKMADKREMKGDLLPSQCPMLFGVGENEAFFEGRMDEICLFKGVLREDRVIELYWELMNGHTGASYGDTGASYGDTGASYGDTGARFGDTDARFGDTDARHAMATRR